MLLPRTTFFINLATEDDADDADDATRLILALRGPCVEERARGPTNEENTADAMENRRRSHRLARQQVVRLGSGVSPRRSDEGVRDGQ